MKILSPFLRLTPIYKDYLWGGDRIAAYYARKGAPTRTAESWEVSAHPDGDNTICGGEFAGRSLSSLIEEFGRTLLGRHAPSSNRFPLLCKVIDAHQSLSVQVHPSPADPLAPQEEYKNECWHILEAAPKTTIYAGLTDVIQSREALAALAAQGGGALASALRRHSPKRGETLYIPAGLVHAIGAGALIYEVQQNSNTTYRLYDWDRIGPDGKPRALHFEAALRSIDYSLPAPSFSPPTQDAETSQGGGLLCLATPYFKIREFTAAATRHPAGDSFEILFVKTGSWRASTPSSGSALADDSVVLNAGDSLLVPACLDEYSLSPTSSNSSILVTTL